MEDPISLPAADWLAGGGEMGSLVRSMDWSRTKLGPIEAWPRSLKTMLGVMLGSRFPMLLWWGPDLLHLYNDAYRPILRDKHPASLGAPAAQVWAEVWDVAGPMARRVQEGGPATWIEDLQLFINSQGIAEETYFTFSYSPVPGDDGRVGGVLNTVQETTAKVQSERQVRMLHELAARAADARSEGEAYRVGLEVLSANELDLPFVLLYVLNEKADAALLVGANGWSDYQGPARPARVTLDEGTGAGSWPLAEVVRSAREVIIDDLAARFGALPVGRWNARPERAIALPLSRVGQSAPYAVLVAGISPHRTLDERYRRFLRATADQIMAVIACARAHEQERKRAEALAEIDRAKTAFFSNVSHEFRTPLTLMLGPLEDELSERDRLLPQARRERIEVAHRNGLRLLKLVNVLLDFARIEAGRVQAQYEPTDLAALTVELSSNFRSAMERGGLTLTVDCPPLPEPIYLDHEMWEKIVLNLLSNAFKHTFQGGIAVRLAWLDGAAQLTVEDSGVGIAAEEIPRLFNRFHRVKGAASRTHEGTGIGLSLVRELVQSHAGLIRVESELGKGSRFIITLKAGTAHLPADKIGNAVAFTARGRSASAYVQEALRWLASTPGTGAAQERYLPDSGAASSVAEQAGPRARILWADDNADMRHYVARLLGRSYEVLAVADGQAALEAARAEPPDLVLSDVMMPRLDGFGLLKALRADERTRRLPVILLSARAGEESAVEGLDAGADDYLVKPFSALELTARVRTHLEMARQRRESESKLEQRVQARTAELAAENSMRESTERKLQAQLERVSLLDHITRAIAERQDLRSIFQVVIRNVEENLPVHYCCICLGDSQTDVLTVNSATESGIPENLRINASDNGLARCLQGELVYETDMSQLPMPLPQKMAGLGLRSLVAAPLRVEGAVLGVLLSARREPDSFSSADCEFLRQLSEHVALAAHQAQLYGELQRAYDDLRQSQQAILQQERLRALGEMASGIAHDINNAISPAALYTESLLEREPGLSERARGCLVTIQTAIEDVAETVSRMREFYRPRETELVLSRVACNHLLEQVINLTRARWSDLPQQRGVVIQLRTELAEELPLIMGSEGELRDALTNLIFNAVDAMPDGGTLTLRTRLLSSASRGAEEAARQVHVEVADTGIGMDEETRRRCLEPFYTTKGERGTGLGLAMVYGMVQRHSAELDIDSAVSRGTTVRLIFAAADALALPVAAGAPLQLPAQRLRILLVDDDPMLIKSLRDILQQDGHVVTVAQGGQQGIDTFAAALAHGTPFSIVITDLGMPYVDGRKVAASVKAASALTPVILLTGWGKRLLAENDIPAHVDRVLSKPPRLGELRAALAKLAAPQDPPAAFVESA
jgi:signal transduction histidine kinase/DNA-binding response OmpR family regulator